MSDFISNLSRERDALSFHLNREVKSEEYTKLSKSLREISELVLKG